MSDKHLKLFTADSSVFDNIREWAEKRGIYESGDSKTQLIKLGEEFGELCDALLKRKDSEVFDAVGDMIVVLTNLVELYKSEDYGIDDAVNIESCLFESYQEIKDRKGQMSNGNFVKDDKS